MNHAYLEFWPSVHNFCSPSISTTVDQKRALIKISETRYKSWLEYSVVITKSRVCGQEYFIPVAKRIKYGIYRPGNLEGNNTSQILYSKINVNSMKKYLIHS